MSRPGTNSETLRNMMFPDGGYRPGYNVQFATDTESGVIVGVETTNAGTDFEQLPPMLDQLEDRYERVPCEALVDGGFATIDTIDRATRRYDPWIDSISRAVRRIGRSDRRAQQPTRSRAFSRDPDRVLDPQTSV